jgi:hypothetical protein
MFSDCFACYRKAIKATGRRLKTNNHLLYFFAFWAITSLIDKKIEEHIEIITVVAITLKSSRITIKLRKQRRYLLK